MELEKLAFEDLETKVAIYLRDKKSFELGGLAGRMSDAIEKLEQLIGSEGFSSRVYTANRSATLGGFLIPFSPTFIAAAATSVTMAVHNIVTFNPDYEIAKFYIDKRVTVMYKK